MRTISVSPIVSGTAVVRIQQNDPGASAALATISPTHLGAGPSEHVLPVGTVLNMTSATLADATAPVAVPAVGDTLSCHVRLRTGGSSTVIDIESCAPSGPDGTTLVAGTIRP